MEYRQNQIDMRFELDVFLDIFDDLAGVDKDLVEVTLIHEDIYKIMILALNIPPNSDGSTAQDAILKSTDRYLEDIYDGCYPTSDPIVVSAIEEFSQGITDCSEFQFTMSQLRKMISPLLSDDDELLPIDIDVDYIHRIFTVSVLVGYESLS